MKKSVFDYFTPVTKIPSDTIVVDGTEYVRKDVAPADKTIILSSKDINDISMTVGGTNLTTPDQVVKLFQDLFKLKVNGVEIVLDVEDAHALKEQALGLNFLTYEDYLRETVLDSLSLFLHGSTRGTFVYR